MPNLTNLAFLEAVGIKNCLAFWMFFFNIWLFLEAVRTYYQLGVLVYENLAEK